MLKVITYPIKLGYKATKAIAKSVCKESYIFPEQETDLYEQIIGKYITIHNQDISEYLKLKDRIPGERVAEYLLQENTLNEFKNSQIIAEFDYEANNCQKILTNYFTKYFAKNNKIGNINSILINYFLYFIKNTLYSLKIDDLSIDILDKEIIFLQNLQSIYQNETNEKYKEFNDYVISPLSKELTAIKEKIQNSTSTEKFRENINNIRNSIQNILPPILEFIAYITNYSANLSISNIRYTEFEKFIFHRAEKKSTSANMNIHNPFILYIATIAQQLALNNIEDIRLTADNLNDNICRKIFDERLLHPSFYYYAEENTLLNAGKEQKKYSAEKYAKLSETERGIFKRKIQSIIDCIFILPECNDIRILLIKFSALNSTDGIRGILENEYDIIKPIQLLQEKLDNLITTLEEFKTNLVSYKNIIYNKKTNILLRLFCYFFPKKNEIINDCKNLTCIINKLNNLKKIININELNHINLDQINQISIEQKNNLNQQAELFQKKYNTDLSKDKESSNTANLPINTFSTKTINTDNDKFISIKKRHDLLLSIDKCKRKIKYKRYWINLFCIKLFKRKYYNTYEVLLNFYASIQKLNNDNKSQIEFNDYIQKIHNIKHNNKDWSEFKKELFGLIPEELIVKQEIEYNTETGVIIPIIEHNYSNNNVLTAQIREDQVQERDKKIRI